MISFPDKQYEVIYCDPPYDYGGQKQHNGKQGEETGGAASHYPTVTLADLKKLPVQDITNKESCVMFMWTTSPHLDQAIELGKAWGFKYITIGFVWHKEATNPGAYTLSQCEICLVFKKGKRPERIKELGSNKQRQFYSEKRKRHSAKPQEFRKRIEIMYPKANRIEMFAREPHEGWDVWGNEV